MFIPYIQLFNNCAFGFGRFMTPPPPMPAYSLPMFGMLTCMPRFHMPVFSPVPIACNPMSTALFTALYSHPTNSKSYTANSNLNKYNYNNSNYSSYINYNYSNSNYSYSNPFASVPVTNTTYKYKYPDSYKYINYTPSYVYDSSNNYFEKNDYSLFNTRSTGKSSNKYSITNVNNNVSWKNLGYNASAGLKLASYALNHAVGFIGYCAKYVKNAIAATGLGSYVNGDAWQMTSILRRNKNFKEISPGSVNLNNLPAGCILVYGKGVSGYSSEYGHVEITTGDGRAVSDGITDNLKNKPTAIFMPVAA